MNDMQNIWVAKFVSLDYCFTVWDMDMKTESNFSLKVPIESTLWYMHNHLQLRLHQSIEEIFATNHREKYSDFENYQKNF